MSDEKKTTQLTGAFYLGGQRLDTSHAETMEYVRSRFAPKPAQPVEAVDVRAAFERYAGAKGYALHVRDMKGSTRLGEYGYADTQRLWETWQAALAQPRPTGDGMVSVVAEDANNYCRILTELGMEEEGDPVAEVKRLAGIAERTHESSFQHGVATWMDQCFLPSLYSNMTERGDRLIEEVLELLQSHGYDQSRVATLVDYVYGRPVGEPAQEVGGVMVTLAGYCWVAGLDMHAAGAAELARITQPAVMAKIRAKQEAKNALHFDTPLPGNAPGLPAAVPTGAVALMSVAQNGDPIFQTIEGWNELSPGNHLLYAAPTGEQAGDAEIVQSVAYRYRKRGCGGAWRYGSMSHRNRGSGPNRSVFEVEMLTRSADAQPRPVGLPDDAFYLQDSRSYTGNCPMWWALNGKGYTTNLDQAHRYTRAEAMRQHRERETDVPWSCAQIDTIRRPTVDIQQMGSVRKQVAMLAAAPAPGKGGEV